MRPSNRNVFINCPFDEEYKPLFRAICFTTVCSGFNPRSVLEFPGSGQSRLNKIYDLVAQCGLGIHDISRTELNAAGFPRFNMPFELGLFLACRRYGGKAHRGKHVLVLDREPHRYNSYLSDLAGHDPESHRGEVRGVISAVRNWLQAADGGSLRGPLYMTDDFRLMAQDLPVICAGLGLDDEQLSFHDSMVVVRTWLRDLDRALPG